MAALTVGPIVLTAISLEEIVAHGLTATEACSGSGRVVCLARARHNFPSGQAACGWVSSANSERVSNSWISVAPPSAMMT